MSPPPQLTAAPSQSSSRPTLLIAVIITAHGPARHLEQALASIRDQTAIPTETVVVDDTSRDADVVRITEAAGVARLRHPLGPHVGRNVASWTPRTRGPPTTPQPTSRPPHPPPPPPSPSPT